MPARPGPVRAALPAAGDRPRTIVLLDPNRDVHIFCKQLFGSMGFDVRCYALPQEFFTAGPPVGAACLLLELEVGGISGLEIQSALKRIGWPLPVIFLAARADVCTAVHAIHAGASDFLLKTCKPAELMAAVNCALESAVRTSAAADNKLELLRRAESLTSRERQIVCLVIEGMLNKQIAERLKLALITVKVHRGSAMRKLGARNPAELTRVARIAGVCDFDLLGAPAAGRDPSRSIR
jgi:FixJ family two-component response regulator